MLWGATMHEIDQLVIPALFVVIPAEAEIQDFENTGFRVKPGMTLF
jgi:hypothetical protein